MVVDRSRSPQDLCLQQSHWLASLAVRCSCRMPTPAPVSIALFLDVFDQTCAYISFSKELVCQEFGPYQSPASLVPPTITNPEDRGMVYEVDPFPVKVFPYSIQGARIIQICPRVGYRAWSCTSAKDIDPRPVQLTTTEGAFPRPSFLWTRDSDDSFARCIRPPCLVNRIAR